MSMRAYLNENILRFVQGGRSVALSLSGGTDSACLLFSLIDLGFRPSLYTYTVKEHPSEDLKRAEALSKSYGLPLDVCIIPNDVDNLIMDVRRIIKDGVRGKVNIQCMHGHYHVAPLVRETTILNGSGVDALYGAYRTSAFSGARKDKKQFDQDRQKHLDNPNDDSMIYQSELYAKFGVKVVYPYREQNIIDYLMAFPWEIINKPRLKWITVRDYMQEFQRFNGLYRPRGSQQIVAGTRALHDKLLRTPLNRLDRKRVDEIYKDIAAGRV